MGFRTLPVRSGGGNDDTPNFPFKGILKNFGTADNPDWKCGVYWDSSIYKTRSLDDDMEIVGLLSKEDPDKNDKGWRDTSDGDEVGVEVSFDTTTNDPTSASVKSNDKDGDWIKGSEIQYEKTGSGEASDPLVYIQKYGRRVCFRIEADPKNDNNLLVKQSVRNDLYIEYGVGTARDKEGSSPHVVFAGILFQD